MAEGSGRYGYGMSLAGERSALVAGSESARVGFLAAEVAGSALHRARASEFPGLRKRPGPVPEGWSRTPPSLLRYSDEQTVVATASVFSAIEAMGAEPGDFEGWGVVAASRYLGRSNLAAALRSFAIEGVWGTSPHLIPHFALHSPSGTISLALGFRGPNIGAGGGLHGAVEGFLAATTWLAGGVVPGVWLVLSGWSPERVPDPSPSDDAECQAIALALRPVADAKRGVPRFQVRIGGGDALLNEVAAPIDLVRLAGDLGASAGWVSRTVATDPPGRVWVELVSGPEGPG